MKIQPAEAILPTLTAAIGIGSLACWLTIGPPTDLEARMPGRDQTIDQAASAVRPEPGEPVTGVGVASEVSGQWPRFLGENGDSIAIGGPPLARACQAGEL